MNEFALIRKYFAPLGLANAAAAAEVGIVLGIGDDCALLQPTGQQLALTTDTLVEGRHFPVGADAYDIGWKSLAVSLSDLAAMSAEPLAFLLSITLPALDENWLAAFSSGLAAVSAGGIPLIGGNTTRGPLAITTTAIGQLKPGSALRRDGARVGDVVAVTGTLGDAALALQLGPEHKTEDLARRFLAARLARPSPRIAAGLALREVAHAAIDLSDGLLGDLGHILTASGCGAELRADWLPMSPAFEVLSKSADRLALQAAGGDDYELCVCLPESALETLAVYPRLTPVGRVVAEPGLRWLAADGACLHVDFQAYRHF